MLVNRCDKFPFAQIGFIVPLHVTKAWHTLGDIVGDIAGD